MVADHVIKEGEVAKSNIIISSIKFKRGGKTKLCNGFTSCIDIDKKQRNVLIVSESHKQI